MSLSSATQSLVYTDESLAQETPSQDTSRNEKEMSILILPKTKVNGPPSGVFPKSGHLSQRITIITDGTTRATGGDYVQGGQNVVKIAKELANREKYPEYSSFNPWILSPENIKKRPDSFFDQIYKAFLVLGIKILSEGELVSSNIRMQVAGDLNLLTKRGSAGARLAKMIQTVCELTHHITNPDLTLDIGIGNDFGKTNVIIRTGMEEEGAIRISGLQFGDSAPLIYGTPTYWPNFQESDIENVIDSVRKATGQIPTLESGYELTDLLDILQNGQIALSLKGFKSLSIDIPYADYGNPTEFERLKKFLKSPKFQAWLSILQRSVQIHNSDGPCYQFGYNPNEALVTYRVIPPLEAREAHCYPQGRKERRYDALIAPGQRDYFVPPRNLDIGYANVFLGPLPQAGKELTCEIEAEDILTSVNNAIDFKIKHEALQGAQRVTGREKKGNEFKRYTHLQKLLFTADYKNLSAEEAAQKYLHTTPLEKEGVLVEYNTVADFFAAKMLNWAKVLGNNIFEKSWEKRAFINYAFTSFFLTYYPHHPEWKALGEDWEKSASCIAQYMGLVFLMDEHIYDNPSTDQSFRRLATSILSQAIRNETIDPTLFNALPENQKKWLTIVSQGYKMFSHKLQTISAENLYKRWQEDMIDLFEGSVKEWEKEKLYPSAIEKLMIDYNNHIAEFRSQYLSDRLPEFLYLKIEAALEVMRTGSSEEKQKASYDLRQYLYLITIEQTIGAKLTYMTYNCIDTKSLKFNDNLQKEFEELGSLINYYYRLANDYAECYRNRKDQDRKPADSYGYMYEKYKQERQNDTEATLYSACSIKQLLDELHTTIQQKQASFFEKTRTGSREIKWWKLAIMILRTRMAEDFYKGTHYREANRNRVSEILQKYFYLGTT